MSRGNASRPCQPAIPRAPRTVSSSGQPRAASSGAGLVSLATGGWSGSRPWTSCRTRRNALPGSVLASHRTVLAPGEPRKHMQKSLALTCRDPRFVPQVPCCACLESIDAWRVSRGPVRGRQLPTVRPSTRSHPGTHSLRLPQPASSVLTAATISGVSAQQKSTLYDG